MRAKIIFLSILFATGLTLAGNFIPFDGISLQGGLTAITSETDYTGATVQIDINGIMVENLIIQGETYSRLYWDNTGVSGKIGQAEIPVYRLYLEIPYKGRVDITVETIERLEFNLNELTVRGAIYPVQPPLEKLPGAQAVFQKDHTYYSRKSYSQDPIAEVEQYFIIRGHQIAAIIIRPLDYNPAQNQVAITTNLRLHFNFLDGDLNRTLANFSHYQSPYFQQLVNSLISNPGVFATDELPNPVGYLVISADNSNYLTIIDPLVEWKHFKGFHTTVVTTAVTGTTTNQIKDYILNAYNTWEVPPSFVLLVGDVNYIPNWTGQGTGSPPTDLYYAAIEGGDYFPDLGLSRFSPGNLSDLQNMVNKTLNVEQVLWSGNDDWEKHATFMASNDNWTVSEGTHNYVISNYLDPNGYTSDRLYCHTYSATTQQVTDAFNQGRSQGTYSGHGSVTSWADGPPFSQANVQALVNSVFPVIQSYACLTGNFTADECFGETWIREPEAGLAFIGSTVTSFWNEDDILEKRVYEGWYDNQNPGDTVNFTWINGFIDYGKIGLYNYYGNTSIVLRYFEMYNVLGDGSVDMWTDIPQIITVQHPSVMFLGTSQITISASGYPQWALVCAHSTAQEEVWASGYLNSTGTITLNFDTPPTLPGEMVITVTGHDIDPVVESIPLTPATGPYVVFNSLSINDVGAWNPNGQLDYDEEVLLNMTLQNVGVENALGVNAIIRSDEPAVTILDSTAIFGDINANNSVTVNNAFQIAVLPEVSNGQVLEFEVEAFTATQSWVTGFNITVYAPEVSVLQVEVDDAVGGNGNMALDPGENADITVTLTNGGGCVVDSVVLILSSIDPYITVNVSSGNYGTILPTGSASANMNITVDNTCPQNNAVSFNCDITGAHSYTTEDDFTLVVGNILYMPIGPDNYGYSAYDIHDSPILPVYNWIEIDPNLGGPGSEIVFTSDDQTFRYDLPFTFTYYGLDYTRYSVCSNGWIAMGETNSTDYSNSGIPNSDGPPSMIAPFWDDLSPQIIGTVAQYYDSAQNIFIVEYSGVRQYTPTTAIETFEIILYDPAHYQTITGDGEIKFQYQRVSDPSSCTIGIENNTQTIGIQYLFDNTYDIHASEIDSAMAILFTTGREIPDLDIALNPVITPIIIPAIGGSFDYNLLICNNGASMVIFDGWLDVTLPDSSLYGPILLRENLILFPGVSILRDMTQSVPGSAPAGNYTYWGHVGLYPATIYDEDSFPFSKSGMNGNSNGFNGWNISGWAEEANTLSATLPDNFHLAQNYPNPFNPSTSINFSIPQRSEITLKVYDVLGREISTLVAGEVEPGVYTLRWDACNYSAGIYFIRLKTKNYESAVKALLIK